MSNSKRNVKTNFERTDREKLELFVNRIDELRETRLAKSGFKIGRKIHGELGQPVEYTLEQPDEADLKKYLMTFRHFIAQEEDIFLFRIFGICHRKLIVNEVKQDLIQKREWLKQIEQHNWMPLEMNGHKVTPLQVTDMYLNGKYFHNDLGHQQFLDSLPPFIAQELRYRFLDFVVNTSRIALHMRTAVNHAFEENLFQFENTSGL